MSALPVSARCRHAYADGYAARLAGASRWSNPYDVAGWTAALAHAWWDGWRAADEVTEPIPAPPRRRRRRAA